MRIETGAILPELSIDAVDSQRMKVMTLLLRDSNPIHFDPDAVRALGLGDRTINQGPTNLGYVMSMLAGAFGDLDRLQRVHARFLGNVAADDAVVAGGTVAAVDAGRATCKVWLDRQDGSRVLQGSATVRIDTRAT